MKKCVLVEIFFKYFKIKATENFAMHVRDM